MAVVSACVSVLANEREPGQPLWTRFADPRDALAMVRREIEPVSASEFLQFLATHGIEYDPRHVWG